MRGMYDCLIAMHVSDIAIRRQKATDMAHEDGIVCSCRICKETDQNFTISVPGFNVVKERKTAAEQHQRSYVELKEFLLYYLAGSMRHYIHRLFENGPELA
ncbi:hypothetical protein Y032_0155g3071 [Ancylostoma ceylanicum]|uniref:Uncharacterized protein n=1 Tax=Ancylostoma ceylanicum TaxID=53326 RepID=A0A016SZM1_9BILA|nr:hypothetical protein Y032_0155g3071 [Ancylostoma ceylanicum]